MTRRLLLSYLGLTLAILIVLEVPLAINYGERLRSELSADLVRDAFAIAGFAEETIEGNASSDLGQLAARYATRTGGRVVIVDKSGRVVADSAPGRGGDDFSTRPEIDEALRGEVATGTRHSDTLNTELLYVAVPVASTGEVVGAVRITYSTEQINDRWRSYLLTLAAITVVSMAAAALLGVLFARWVARPLQRLEDAAEGVGGGDLSARAAVAKGPPEVRRLSAAFDSMAARLDELVQAQESFVADASHQLRSPLAALRFRIENLQSELASPNFPTDAGSPTDGPPDGGPADDSRAAALDDVDAALRETARLSRIVDGLLALARADRPGTATATSLSTARVLDERAAAWQPVAGEHGVQIEVAGRDWSVVAVEDRLSQALDNVLANAIEASPEGGTIRLEARLIDRMIDPVIELHVIDEGPGLSEEQRTRAFDRFWRVSSSSGDLGGSGLGLAIARKLVVADGGDLALRSAGDHDHGIDAVISLPPASQLA